jgi:hypothetical protein
MRTAYRKDGKKIQVGLESAVRKWPTPNAADANRKGADYAKAARGAGGDDLQTAVLKQFRTPSSRDWKGMSAASWRSRTSGDPTPTLPDQDGGQLNPPWVEWLMGFPLGWTDLEVSATPSSHK